MEPSRETGQTTAKKLIITLVIIITAIAIWADYRKEIEEFLPFFKAKGMPPSPKSPPVSDEGEGKKVEEFFPLTEGRVWRFTGVHSQKGKITLAITVLPQTELKGKQAAPLKYEAVNEKGKSIYYTVYVRREAGAIFQFAMETSRDFEPRRYTPIYYLKEPIKPGTSWNGRASGSIISIDDEVTVPAGTFKGCVKVTTSFAKEERTQWFAPGIGPVKIFHDYGKLGNSLFQLESYK